MEPMEINLYSQSIEFIIMRFCDYNIIIIKY